MTVGRIFKEVQHFFSIHYLLPRLIQIVQENDSEGKNCVTNIFSTNLSSSLIALLILKSYK